MKIAGILDKWLLRILIIGILLYAGRPLFVPLSFGLLVAVLSYPLCAMLERRGWPRSLAITVLLFSLIVVFVLLGSLLAYEFQIFMRDISGLGSRLQQLGDSARDYFQSRFGLTPELRRRFLLELSSGLGQYLHSLASVTSGTFVNLFLVPVYAALFLFHRATFVRFLLSFAEASQHRRLRLLLTRSIDAYFKFVRGAFYVYCIVAVLNSAGLLLLGIKHAILFGTVTAFMTIIPYAGIIISAALPVSVALLTGDTVWYAAGVVFVFALVQYLEANVIFPAVVGTQVNLSTWAMLVSAFAGALLWGLPGMILFIPFIAILKLASDQVPEWKPLRILLERGG